MTSPKLVEIMLAEARSELGHADHKASVLLGALGIAVGAAMAGFIAGDWSPSKLEGFAVWLWWGGAIATAGAIAAATTAVWPRVGYEKPIEAVTFWGHIQEFDNVDDLRDFCRNKEIEVEARSYGQLFAIGTVLLRKYRCVRAALGCSTLAGLLLVAAGLWTIWS